MLQQKPIFKAEQVVYKHYTDNLIEAKYVFVVVVALIEG